MNQSTYKQSHSSSLHNQSQSSLHQALDLATFHSHRVEHDERLEQIDVKLDRLLSILSGQTKPLLTVSEVAALTDRSEDSVRRWIRDGRLPAQRVSGTGPRGKLLVNREDLDRLLEDGLGGDISPIVVSVGDSSNSV